MMRSSAFAVILLWVAGAGIVHARDYYVSWAGEDSNPGTQARPWRTVDRVNAAGFQPGDHVHFQGAERFPGTAVIKLDR